MPPDEKKYFQEIESLKNVIDSHIIDSQDFRSEFRKSQENIGEALVGLARSQEKLIALNHQTESNSTSIQQLYDLNRETNKNVTSHILQEAHSTSGQPDSITDKAKKFDKIQMTLILGVGSWILNIIYNVYQKLMIALNGG